MHTTPSTVIGIPVIDNNMHVIDNNMHVIDNNMHVIDNNMHVMKYVVSYEFDYPTPTTTK